MKTKFYLNFNKLIAFFITFLGFTTGCERDHYDRYSYGTISSSFVFIAKGSIKSEKDNSPLKNVRIIMTYDNKYNQKQIKDTSYSDVNGNYIVKSDTIDNWYYRFNFHDTDSTHNGEFQDLDTIIELNNPKFTGGDGSWYKGQTEMEVNVKLKPKK